ncbi:hypothetical protein OIU78_008697 [Salix suchowensis]|nr:hypothetical protein OIU78_008697 [Salix suchowensis]
MNSADAVDFGSTDATAITHPRRRWLTGRVIPLGWNIEDVPLVDPSIADHGTFPPWVSYKFTLDGAGTSEVPPDGDARAMSTVFMCWSVMIVAFPGSMDLDFGIDSLANGLGRVGSFDLGRRIDELKEQKAVNIVGESNIERKLWWDLGSIDMLMSRSVFLGRTCASSDQWAHVLPNPIAAKRFK